MTTPHDQTQKTGLKCFRIRGRFYFFNISPTVPCKTRIKKPCSCQGGVLSVALLSTNVPQSVKRGICGEACDPPTEGRTPLIFCGFNYSFYHAHRRVGMARQPTFGEVMLGIMYTVERDGAVGGRRSPVFLIFGSASL